MSDVPSWQVLAVFRFLLLLHMHTWLLQFVWVDDVSSVRSRQVLGIGSGLLYIVWERLLQRLQRIVVVHNLLGGHLCLDNFERVVPKLSCWQV